MNKVKCKIDILEGGTAPFHGSKKSAGYDLTARKIEMITPFKYRIYLGVRMEPEEGFRISAKARSSNTKSMWTLSNNVGVIDEDYRGELMAIFDCIPTSKPFEFVTNEETKWPKKHEIDIIDFEPFPYKEGDRVIQILLVPWYEAEWIVTDDLSQTGRGDKGFGSTDKKQ